MVNSAVQLDTSEFLDELLSCSNSTPNTTASTANVFSKLENANELTEDEIASRFIDAVSFKTMLPSTISRYGRSLGCFDGSMTTVDVAIFHESTPDEDGRPSWFDQVAPVEFQSYSEGADPFDTSVYEDTYGEIALGRKRLLERINATVELLFAAQQRTAVFMLLVIGRSFRMLRWDRAGIIVSPSADYFHRPDILYDFLWRVSVLDESKLGFDSSSTRVFPGSLDYLRMDMAALRDSADVDHDERDLSGNEVEGSLVFEYVRTAFRASLESDWPRYKFQVPDGGSVRNYLVGKPVFGSSGALGRGTRGYVAYDCKTRHFVWLKDAWRASYMVTDTEGDVLAKLNAANVENVPTLVCHGDIRDQTTVSGAWWERKYALSCTLSRSSRATSAFSSHTLAPVGSPSSKKRKRLEERPDTPLSSRHDGDWGTQNPTVHLECPLRQHKHYRIVVEEVALPLKEFVNGRQLVSLLLDCLRAHHQAATNPRTRILHRDISSGNILIYPQIRQNEDTERRSIVWTGLLTDWELSRSVDDAQTPSRTSQAERMGTYQFMSVNLLSNLSKPVGISDELESFLHVLIYFSVRFLRSNCDDVTTFVDGYFNHYEGPGRMHTCGQKSIVMESTGVLRIQFPYGPLLFTDPMDALIDILLQRFRAHYKILHHLARQSAPPAPPQYRSSSPSTPSDTPPRASTKSCVSNDDSDDSDDEDYGWSALKLRLQSEMEERPTAKDEALAAEVHDHHFMLNIFAKALRRPCWLQDDRRPVPPSCRHGEGRSESEPESSGSTEDRPQVVANNNRLSKRRHTSGPERTGNASLPARLHVSSRRTRRSVRTHPIRVR